MEGEAIGSGVLVGLAIAVVVFAVTEFVGARMNQGIEVMAVLGIVRVAGGEGAGFDGKAGIPKGVFVFIEEKGLGHILVDGAIAVVVDGVAYFDPTRVGRNGGVVAVI